MRAITTSLTTILFLASISSSVGQQAPTAEAATSGIADALLERANSGLLSTSPSGFEENKGQVITTEGGSAPFVRYRLSQGSTNIFLLGSGIAYQFDRSPARRRRGGKA